jgi:hypothetical protein
MELRRTVRVTRRATVIGILAMLVATPALASIIVQNFMSADITAATACFNKAAGNDPDDSTLAGYADEATVPQSTYTVTKDGVTLIGEQISLTGLKNDRVIYTDVVRYENNCAEPIEVRLTAPEASGSWGEIATSIWISNVADPSDVDPEVDVLADEWNDDAIVVPASSSGVIADSTGTVTVLPGGEIQGAFVVTTGDGALTTTTATLEWIAEATIVTS